MSLVIEAMRVIHQAKGLTFLRLDDAYSGKGEHIDWELSFFAEDGVMSVPYPGSGGSQAGGGGGLVSGGWAKYDGSGGSGHGPLCAFAGSGGNAHHVIFCIDVSGSMGIAEGNAGPSIDLVKEKMLTCIAHLHEVQDFDMVFFHSGKPQEWTPHRLMPATTENKRDAAAYIDKITASDGGGTDPCDALVRCFELDGQGRPSPQGQADLPADGWVVPQQRRSP